MKSWLNSNKFDLICLLIVSNTHTYKLKAFSAISIRLEIENEIETDSKYDDRLTNWCKELQDRWTQN